MERFDVRCRPYYEGAQRDLKHIYQSGTYLFYQQYPGSTMAKTALGDDLVVCGDLSYNELIGSEDSVIEQQHLYLLDQFEVVSAG